ncbi:MAG: hypothetical protein WCD86_24925 [Ktedonobacteraceae bacterium]
MTTRNQRETPTHSSAFHENQLPLFDAYGTDELDEEERVQVEQNLHQCRECQRLFADVTHLRQRLGTLSETEKSAVPADAPLHSPTILQTVLAAIEQGENRRNPLTAEHMKQAPIISRPLSTDSSALFARNRIRTIALRLGAAAVCAILLAGLIITIRNGLLSPGKGPVSVPSPVVWTAQQPVLVQNSAGVFALKEIEITTTKEFRFYYAFHASRQGPIHAAAISSLNVGQHPVRLLATVWPMGTIDDISVGVIRVQYLDRVGQTITLTITSPEEGRMSWKLTPLKQLLSEPHPEGGGFYGFPIDQHLFPEIIWSGPRSGPVGPSQHAMISLFKNAAGTRYIFLQVDYAGKIAVITKEQCIHLVGEQVCH